MLRGRSRVSREPNQADALSLSSSAQRLKAGRAIRDKVPRKRHSGWKAARNRPDPISLLIDSNRGRIPSLLPIRYGRMLKSPFFFLRGAAAIMASDLEHTPTTGIRVQAGGDCHIMNFGAFATPERNLVFDVNDFDETLRAPWEWDLKRLVASVEVAGRAAGFKAKDRESGVRSAVRSYRKHMADYAHTRALEVWYERIEFEPLVKKIPQRAARKFTSTEIERAKRQSFPVHIRPMLRGRNGELARIRDDPPLIYHPAARHRAAYAEQVRGAFKHYRESLPAHYRVLFDRFQYCDMAIKVVGVGSVGTFCAVALFMAPDREPLFLQLKEATASVLEKYAGRSPYANHGERVVVGQRLMQAASDIFLGWTAGIDGNRHFYIRQLRDMKVSMVIDTMNAADLGYYGEACAWALARAHARSGDAAMIAGYLGSGDVFDDALARFAGDYGDQTERDHAALVKAVKAGRINAAKV
jgi:uncharacterized protein (DUF2252 family)